MKVLGDLDVPRETSERLAIYADLIRKWNPKINLVSKASLAELEERHILDGVQVARIATGWSNWTDLGSGGGFPGLVVAIINPNRPVKLVESDQRKAAFLRAVIRETEVNAQVVADRIEKLEPLVAEVLSARALAPLVKLLEYGERHLGPQGTAVFPKGETWRQEISQAEAVWRFQWEAIESTTHPKAVILKIGGIARV